VEREITYKLLSHCGRPSSSLVKYVNYYFTISQQAPSMTYGISSFNCIWMEGVPCHIVHVIPNRAVLFAWRHLLIWVLYYIFLLAAWKVPMKISQTYIKIS